jgi:ABC-type transporter Mla subunit MlaD
MDDKLTIFIAVTSAAVVLQMLILLGMFLTMRKLAARVQALADKAESTSSDLQAKILPVVDQTKTFLTDAKTFFDQARPKVESMLTDTKTFLDRSRPKVDGILDNASEISSKAKATAGRVDVTVNDAVDRIRLQLIRGDEMVTRTMDRVEETSEKVQHTVMSPVRQVSGIMQAISTGVGAFFNHQKRRNGGPSDEMFI